MLMSLSEVLCLDGIYPTTWILTNVPHHMMLFYCSNDLEARISKYGVGEWLHWCS